MDLTNADSADVQRSEVEEIFAMHASLRSAALRAGAAERHTAAVQFRGFDAGTEQQYDVAEEIVAEHPDILDTLGIDALPDSGEPEIEHYRRMMDGWRRVGRWPDLSLADILRIASDGDSADTELQTRLPLF